jgi:hypothetical protein
MLESQQRTWTGTGDPVTNFKMEFHVPPNGVVVTYDCRTELNYLRVKVLLQDLVGGPCSPDDTDRTDPIFYYIETEQQKETLFSFLRTLRRQPG